MRLSLKDKVIGCLCISVSTSIVIGILAILLEVFVLGHVLKITVIPVICYLVLMFIVSWVAKLPEKLDETYNKHYYDKD